MSRPTIWASIEACAWSAGFDYEEYCIFHEAQVGVESGCLNEEEYMDVCNALESYLYRNAISQ